MAIDTIKASAILDGAIDTADIADDAVTSAKLDNNIDIAGTLDVTGQLTADGNVLVGTTEVSQYDNNSDSSNDNGISLRGSIGKIEIARYNSEALDVNRTGTEGNLAVFRKNGTPVGSIGTSSSTGGMYIDGGSSATGLRFGNSGHVIPRRGNADSDANVDFGVGTNRFRNLYLSGGAYIGGTAAANYLDDVEEGEWTPVIVGSSSGTATGSAGAGSGGSYIKIKNHVWLQFYFANPSISGTMSGDLYLNLPFTNANNDQYDNGSGGEINTHRYFRSGATTYKITMRIVRGESRARFRVQRLGVDTEDYPLNQSTANLITSTLIWGQLKMRV